MPTEIASPEPLKSFPALVQAFFTDYLVEQRALSPQAVAGYRDAFSLFFDVRPPTLASGNESARHHAGIDSGFFGSFGAGTTQ